MIVLGLLLAAQAQPVVVDQTNDIALVSAFLDALRSGDRQRARTMLAADATVRKYDDPAPTPLASFARFPEGCGLRAVMAGPPYVPTQRMQIQADWGCNKLGDVRHAHFIVRDGRIGEIRWGEIPKGPLPVIRPVEKR